VVHLEQQRLADIVAQQLEPRAIEQMSYIVAAPREEVVETDDVMALADQPLAQMRADEARPSGYQHPHE
jgi:hypothetical protein